MKGRTNGVATVLSKKSGTREEFFKRVTRNKETEQERLNEGGLGRQSKGRQPTVSTFKKNLRETTLKNALLYSKVRASFNPHQGTSFLWKMEINTDVEDGN